MLGSSAQRPLPAAAVFTLTAGLPAGAVERDFVVAAACRIAGCRVVVRVFIACFICCMLSSRSEAASSCFMIAAFSHFSTRFGLRLPSSTTTSTNAASAEAAVTIAVMERSNTFAHPHRFAGANRTSEYAFSLRTQDCQQVTKVVDRTSYLTPQGLTQKLTHVLHTARELRRGSLQPGTPIAPRLQEAPSLIQNLFLFLHRFRFGFKPDRGL